MPAKVMPETAYGFSQALLGVTEPIIARRNPTTADKATVGTPWINKVNNTYYVCTSVTNNAAFWAAGASSPANIVTAGFITAGTALTSGTTLDVGTTATIGTGLTVTAGGATITAGGLTITAGGETITAGDLTLTAGDIALTAGSITAATDNEGFVLANGASIISNGDDINIVGDAAGDVVTILGDAAGADAVIVLNSALGQLFQLNSLGVSTFAADVTITLGDINILNGNVDFDTIGNGISFKNTASITDGPNNIVITAKAVSGGVTLKLGDAAGATALSMTDSADVEVLNINSDGAVQADGSLQALVLRAADTGDSGLANTNSFTGLTNASAISTGVGSIKMTTAVAVDNAGFIKCYVGATPVWIPYFDAQVS